MFEIAITRKLKQVTLLRFFTQDLKLALLALLLRLKDELLNIETNKMEAYQ